jgi:hypothetical protein
MDVVTTLPPKGPLSLINILIPPVGISPTFLIGDGLPFYSRYNFFIRNMCGILMLCFLLEELPPSSEGSPLFVTTPTCATP